jgi:hypothetical protein
MVIQHPACLTVFALLQPGYITPAMTSTITTITTMPRPPVGP